MTMSYKGAGAEFLNDMQEQTAIALEDVIGLTSKQATEKSQNIVDRLRQHFGG